jgi:hypothetical protein
MQEPKCAAMDTEHISVQGTVFLWKDFLLDGSNTGEFLISLWICTLGSTAVNTISWMSLASDSLVPN